MLHTYSIVPLTESCFEDICNDVKDQYVRGISSVPLFKMVLVPEGEPVWEKAKKQCATYARYRDVLEPQGVKTGVLIQASLGHGYKLVKNPFQRVINLKDGMPYDVCCPEDPNFIEHFKDVVRQVALERPSAIMLDDDVRLMMRPGRGCVCDRHMAKFNELTGMNMNSRELYDYLRTHPSDDPVNVAYMQTQRDSIVHFVTQMRAAIDEIDPTIQGINCTSGTICESVIYTNPIFAGKGNPTIVRVPNGTYAPENVRGFSNTMKMAAICGSKLKKHGIDIVLAETDTLPFNRYGKNARYLHAHYTASLLEGLSGAKHWLTRFSDHELNSGKAFKDILANHKGFYEKLSELADGIRWIGVDSMFVEQIYMDFSKEDVWNSESNDWIKCIIERMGIPFHYSEQNTGAAFLEDDIVRRMDDKQIEELFEGSVFLDSRAAADLIERGFGDKLGVRLESSEGIVISGESFDGTINSVCTRQKNAVIIVPTDPKTETLSYNYSKIEDEAKIVSPAVTVYPRENGKITVVYCGIPLAQFNYIEGFAFLNETRKKQFVSLLKRAQVLPVYYPGDVEICLRAGYLKDERLLVAVYDLSYDPMDNIELYLENCPQSIKIVAQDGTEQDVEWESVGDNLYTVDVRVEPLYPVVLLIK